MKPSDIVRFTSKIDKSRGACGCWLWTARTFPKGYGAFALGGRDKLAHRIAYTLAFGAPLKSVLHTCDNRRCCNPFHLLDGTQQENLSHMVARNRQARGVKNGATKLSPAQVLAIRLDQRSHKRIATAYGVAPSLIGSIKLRRHWRHL